MLEKEIMDTSTIQQRRIRRCVIQIAGGVLLLLVLCANQGRNHAATATPSANSQAIASSTATILTEPTDVSSPSPITPPTPQATDSAVATATVALASPPGPCETPSGVQPVSSIEIESGIPSKPQIALTFDAGGDAAPAPELLHILKRRAVPATWFFTGNWAKQHPEIVRTVVEAGYEIGNHSMTHPDLTKLADRAVCNELTQAEQTISAIAGRTTRPYFRPPFGARNQLVRQLAAQLGYRTVYWTIDTLDWQTSSTPASILQRIFSSRLTNGAIILMHAGSASEVQALDKVITLLQQQGYQLVTLSQILL